MNSEQARQIQKLDRDMLGVQRELDELQSFNYAPMLPDPLQFYGDFKAQLAQCQHDIEVLPSTNQDALEGLVTREATLIESLNGAAREAQQVLGLEQRAFFHQREEFTHPLDDAITRADDEIVKALAQFYQALQARWTAMQRRAEVVRLLSVISERYDTSPRIGAVPPRLSKPFSKIDLTGWGRFIQVFLGRVGEVFEGGENSTPADVARTIFEKPERIDIGQDEGFKSSRQYLEGR